MKAQELPTNSTQEGSFANSLSAKTAQAIPAKLVGEVIHETRKNTFSCCEELDKGVNTNISFLSS